MMFSSSESVILVAESILSFKFVFSLALARHVAKITSTWKIANGYGHNLISSCPLHKDPRPGCRKPIRIKLIASSKELFKEVSKALPSFTTRLHGIVWETAILRMYVAKKPNNQANILKDAHLILADHKSLLH
jgi:hypothetical protein